LARLSRLPHGLELLEGNVHDQMHLQMENWWC
jgi:hypothetical protein